MRVQQAAENANLLRYFAAQLGQRKNPPEAAVLAESGPMPKVYGTHPDLEDRLWIQLGRLLPEDCCWVVYGRPVLVRRSSGIIFAFASGTHTYAMRLPPDARAAALEAGATRVYHYRAFPESKVVPPAFDLSEIGDEWVFCQWLKGEEDWCRAAYEFAGNSESRASTEL